MATKKATNKEWIIPLNEFFERKITYQRSGGWELLRITFQEKVLNEDGEVKEVITWDSIEFDGRDLDEFIEIVELIKKECGGGE